MVLRARASPLGFVGKKIIYLSPIVEQVEPVGDGAADGAPKAWRPNSLHVLREPVDLVVAERGSMLALNARYTNRPIAVCFAGKDDLQALMVSAGWAWAYTAFSDQYVDAERRAAARGVGVHAHRCQPPWEWRALKRAERYFASHRARHRMRWISWVSTI
jgi:hypothetical protein